MSPARRERADSRSSSAPKMRPRTRGTSSSSRVGRLLRERSELESGQSRFNRPLPRRHAAGRIRARISLLMAHAMSQPAVRAPRLHGTLAFFTIYVVWGSTVLASRYAVESIPPLFVAGTRHFIAGAILLAWAWSQGERPTRSAWRNALVLGFLFFFVSHGLLHWAELTVPSGVAALVIATEPAMVALLLPLLELGPAPRGLTYVGLALGAGSVAVLF